MNIFELNNKITIINIITNIITIYNIKNLNFILKI